MPCFHHHLNILTIDKIKGWNYSDKVYLNIVYPLGKRKKKIYLDYTFISSMIPNNW